jgi:RNA polymerase sigma-70 factor, ECF subfamily
MPMSDEDRILILSAQKNPLAFERVYQKYYQKIYNYFWYRVGFHKETAEDLTQDTFTKAFNKLASFRIGTASYYTYLLTVAHNTLVNFFREKKPGYYEQAPELPLHIREQVENSVDLERMWKDIERLPTLEKEAILLRYRREYPFKKIARIMAKSENAVKLIISRAKKRLTNVNRLRLLASLPDMKKKPIQRKLIK